MGVPIGKIANAGLNILGGTGTLALNALGHDTTPGYSATNVVKTQLGAPAYSDKNDGAKPASNTTATTPQVLGYNTDQSAASGVYNAQSAQAAAAAQAAASNNAYIDSQLGNLNSLLGRTDTGLDQGLSQLNDSYTGNVNAKTNEQNQALQDYADQRVSTNKDKLTAYDTAGKNANNGYRSLAQIIGRASGSGSSAFQDLLPDVVGKDLSSKRGEANDVYASNLGNIDTAQKKTEQSFASILADLANQRSSQEQQLRTGVENQKQSILGQQQTLQASRGNVGAATALQPAIENSRNSVESFFNQFKPTVTAQQAAIAAPDLSGYQVDRSTVNAQNQGVADPTNPYADILRKKLQDGAV